MPVLIGAALSPGRAAAVVLGVAFRRDGRNRRRCGDSRRQFRIGLHDCIGFRCRLVDGSGDGVSRRCLRGVGGTAAVGTTASDGCCGRAVAASAPLSMAGLRSRLPSGLSADRSGLAPRAAAGFDASTVDVLVAIAAAAIASGCVVLAGDAGATTTSVAATGTAIATATGSRRYAAVDGGGLRRCSGIGRCGGVGRGDDVRSRVLDGCFHDAGLRDPGFAVWRLRPRRRCRRQRRAVRRWVPSSCEGGVRGGARRRCGVARLAVRPTSRMLRRARGDGRSGAAAAGRSLPAVSAALLSISAEKLSGAGDWSARADLDGAF